MVVRCVIISLIHRGLEAPPFFLSLSFFLICCFPSFSDSMPAIIALLHNPIRLGIGNMSGFRILICSTIERHYSSHQKIPRFCPDNHLQTSVLANIVLILVPLGKTKMPYLQTRVFVSCLVGWSGF